MTQEDKELLFNEVCARLPYGTRYYIEGEDNSKPLKANSIIADIMSVDFAFDDCDNCFLSFREISEIKPYLLPLSSMTPKQKSELSMLTADSERMFDLTLIEIYFYHKHHIDYRGLIPMGLANDATGLNIYKIMTREEELRQYLKERNIPITSLEANSIIEGAKWADKTMVDKACEWFEDVDFEMTYIDSEGLFDKEQFINDFVKQWRNEYGK